MTRHKIKLSVLSALPASAAEPVWLGCTNSSSPGGVTYYLIVDLAKATVTIRDFGTYNASITGREITWSAGRNFYRLYRETGVWEIHNDGVSVLQCQRRKPGAVL